MSLKLVLATRNEGKIREIASILGRGFELVTLAEVGLTGELDENSRLIEENALFKARQCFEAAAITSLADDSGLFVDFLKGGPGSLSARYGGSNEERIGRLLGELAGAADRRAVFRCAIAVVGANSSQIFLGDCPGTITAAPCGQGGFGYDPVFIPDGFDKTFAEMGDDVKNRISHRAKALLMAKEFLLSL